MQQAVQTYEKTDFLPPQSTDVAILALPSKKEKQLRNAGINTLEQLVRFFPLGYNDYSKATPIPDLQDGMDCVIVGRVVESKIGGNDRVSFLALTVQDEDDNKVRATFFNQAYLAQNITIGGTYAFCGKAKLDPSGRFPPSVHVRKHSDRPETIMRIMPRYRKIKGMAEAYLIDVIEKAFEYICPADHVHNRFLKACSLMSEYDALYEIHFPTTPAALETAIERIDFDVLLPFAYNLMLRGRERTRPSTYALPKFGYMQKISRKLPFELTGDQKRTINGITRRVNSLQQLNALVQGDVGCGKTIVAIMLLAAVVENGYQGCMMAPTEVLAKQHYAEISERVACVPDIRVELLVGSMKASEKSKLNKEIAAGKVDIVVGTHALIQKTVSFSDLAMAIIDEQHRFGVSQSDMLLKNNNPHIIAMSATPIPRTLSMAIYGEHTEVFNIVEKPAGRQQVQTAVIDKVMSAYKFAYEQIKKGHQAYIVCPFIEDSNNEKFEDIESIRQTEEEVAKVFAFDPSIRYATVNGKMPKADIDAAINSFVQGETHILISTTVIEVGVNVPNATVMIIKNAERFGLAQLHQLRGRVGRTTFPSYCILLTDKNPERCKILVRTTDGFEIAMEDLKLRGHGSYLGARQTGKDEAVALMLTKPGLYKKAQDISRFIDSDPHVAKQYEYLLVEENEDFA